MRRDKTHKWESCIWCWWKSRCRRFFPKSPRFGWLCQRHWLLFFMSTRTRYKWLDFSNAFRSWLAKVVCNKGPSLFLIQDDEKAISEGICRLKPQCLCLLGLVPLSMAWLLVESLALKPKCYWTLLVRNNP